MEAARNIWVVVLYRRLEPAGREPALFSSYLDLHTPFTVVCGIRRARARRRGRGDLIFLWPRALFFHGRDYQEHDRYDL